jgi:spermidine synthase/MFS family permease
MNWYFAFFFFSGFCSLLYELIWLRLTVAQYGVTIAMTSIVLSVFMAGMGAGSWIAGAAARRYGKRLSWSPLRLYGAAELVIGCASLTVPLELLLGRHFLESWSGALSSSSATFYLASGALVALTLIPWCACMGATVPLAMWAIRSESRPEASRSFSFLYTANVIGALAGAIIPAVLIELYGFNGTLRIGACLNFAIAAGAFALSLRHREPSAEAAAQSASATAASIASAPQNGSRIMTLLFLTGFATMGMEVIWIRLYMAFVGPLVYSFALILASYLAATAIGARMYRRRGAPADSRLAWILLGLLSLAPLITADPRLPLPAGLRVILGVVLVSGVIGFLTPMLVDRWSGGDADRAGKAYAVNVLGCILGPLFASFVLLPHLSERVSLAIFALPWFAMIPAWPGSRALTGKARVYSIASVAAALVLLFGTRDYTLMYPGARILRDSTATVIAAGQGMDRKLVTNGVGMTVLTPITKMMAHFSLASLNHQPHSMLVICFGMGTTYRSALSWGIPVTAAELVPSVPKLFTYFHEDGAQVMASPNSHIVVDDGRRYLERTSDKFDVIAIDPPPPVTAAASSLLYSEEFYAAAKRRLQPGGILAQWLPDGDNADVASVTRALVNSFPYVHIYQSVMRGGFHFFASMEPIPERSADELLARMPQAAVTDMMEWGPEHTPHDQLQWMLSHSYTPEELIARAPNVPALRDDRPVNEYFVVRTFVNALKN